KKLRASASTARSLLIRSQWANRLLSASSTAQIRRKDVCNDCDGRGRLNGVVADTAFHDLPGTEPQHFDFGSLERSKRKNDIGGFNLGKVTHGSLSQFLEGDSERQTHFLCAQPA